MGNSLFYAWNEFDENDEEDYEEDYEYDLSPTGHGDICMSDADPGL